MPLVVGVSFKKAGKVYYFDPAGIDLHEGDQIIAETARGTEFGEIMGEPKEVSDAEIVPPLRKIVRKASDTDVQREEANRAKEKQAFSVCQQKIQQHSLPMKLIDAEYCFDGSQITFFFSAESRVDFRELVKDLASALRTKVQLHQVGVRDEAKLFGGMGPCGRPLCCASFLSDFEPVSMKMAKEQSLFLNPLKFSGTCGKLMCCLKYEYPTYKEAKSRLPGMGSAVMTEKGPGRVVEVNVIGETLCVELESGGALLHCSASEVQYGNKPCQAVQEGGCGACCGGTCGDTHAAPETEASTVAAVEPALVPVPEIVDPIFEVPVVFRSEPAAKMPGAEVVAIETSPDGGTVAEPEAGEAKQGQRSRRRRSGQHRRRKSSSGGQGENQGEAQSQSQSQPKSQGQKPRENRPKNQDGNRGQQNDGGQSQNQAQDSAQGQGQDQPKRSRNRRPRYRSRSKSNNSGNNDSSSNGSQG